MKHPGRKITIGGIVAAAVLGAVALALASSSVQLPLLGLVQRARQYHHRPGHVGRPDRLRRQRPACTWSVDGAGNLGLAVATIPQGGSVMCRTSITYKNTGQAALDLQGFTVTTPTAGVTVSSYVEPVANPAGCGLMVAAGAISPGVSLEVQVGTGRRQRLLGHAGRLGEPGHARHVLGGGVHRRRGRAVLVSARSQLYRMARILGDVQAAERGPVPLARRLARKQVYRVTNRWTRRLTREVCREPPSGSLRTPPPGESARLLSPHRLLGGDGVREWSAAIPSRPRTASTKSGLSLTVARCRAWSRLWS